MEEQSLVTLILGGSGLGAVWAIARWYLKEKLQRDLDRQAWRQEVQKRRDELFMAKLRYEQEAMREVFSRFGLLSERMSQLILELALDRATEADPASSGANDDDSSSEIAAAKPARDQPGNA